MLTIIIFAIVVVLFISINYLLSFKVGSEVMKIKKLTWLKEFIND